MQNFSPSIYLSEMHFSDNIFLIVIFFTWPLLFVTLKLMYHKRNKKNKLCINKRYPCFLSFIIYNAIL